MRDRRSHHRKTCEKIARKRADFYGREMREEQKKIAPRIIYVRLAER